VLVVNLTGNAQPGDLMRNGHHFDRLHVTGAKEQRGIVSTDHGAGLGFRLHPKQARRLRFRGMEVRRVVLKSWD
jgi:hypothetical protein